MSDAPGAADTALSEAFFRPEGCAARRDVKNELMTCGRCG